MTIAPIQELVDGKAMVVPLTVEQYHRMIETGILEEGAPIELLDGFLVRKDRSAAGEKPMTVGHQHSLVLGKLMESLTGLRPLGACLRIQQPITLPPDNEPEPDAVIARGDQDTYRHRHPGPDDVTCVIEVADSSLERDRVTKQRLYADNGLPQYVIVNLVDHVVEQYTQPVPGTGRYLQVKVLQAGEMINLFAAGHPIELPVASLLP
jgi:Uma2 family endonuclease